MMRRNQPAFKTIVSPSTTSSALFLPQIEIINQSKFKGILQVEPSLASFNRAKRFGSSGKLQIEFKRELQPWLQLRRMNN